MDDATRPDGIVIDALVDREEAAKILHMRPATLATWSSPKAIAKKKRKGPPFLKIGGRVMYRVRDLKDYLDSCEVTFSGQED